MTSHYTAPWGTSVKLLTVLGLVVSSIAIYVLLEVPTAAMFRVGLTVVLAASVGLSALFTVRGYTLTGRTLKIQRMLWHTELSLSELRAVEHDPRAMDRSLRIFGNGGLFAVTGWFWNRTLRRYRAFATDPTLAVVLRFDTRVVVVSPDPPRDFVTQVRQECGLT